MSMRDEAHPANGHLHDAALVIPPHDAHHLVAEMMAAGYAGPVLVVADHAAISAQALRWAESFAAAGWMHRVIVAGRGTPHEIEQIAAEARSLAAVAVVAAGAAAAIELGRLTAAAVGLPCVAVPAVDPPVGLGGR